MAFFAEDAQQIAKRHIDAHRNNIGAWHHNIVNAMRAEPQDIAEHVTFARRDIIIRLGIRQRVFDVVAD